MRKFTLADPKNYEDRRVVIDVQACAFCFSDSASRDSPAGCAFDNSRPYTDDEVYWRKDRTSVPVEYWSHIVVHEGKNLGAVITFIDITERKKAEAALRRSEERWRSVYENSAIGVALTDLNGRFLL
jgi:PAS domain-containing protein